MFAEDFIVKNAHYIVFIVSIFLLEKAKQFKLNSGLMLEPLLVPDHFNGHHLLRFVIETFQSLPETARPQLIKHLKSVSQMVFRHDLIVTSLVIVTVVVPQKRLGFNFRRTQPQKEDLWVIQNFNFFIVSQPLILVEVKRLSGRHWELGVTHADGRRRLIWIGSSLETRDCVLTLLLCHFWSCSVRILLLNYFEI